MNEMRKLMEAVEGLDGIRETHGDEYVAAVLYLNYQGRTKPQLAKKLSDVTSIDINTANQMISAIDAYEDIREAEEFKHVQEDSTDIQYPSYDEYEGSLDAHVEEINQILRTDPDSWHAAIKVIKQIMDANEVIPGDLE